MGQKVPPGLIKRGDIWHIRKRLWKKSSRKHWNRRSSRSREVPSTSNRADKAVQHLRYSTQRTFREAATKYLEGSNQNQHSRRRLAPEDCWTLSSEICSGRGSYGDACNRLSSRKEQGVKNRTINHAIQTVRHILNLAAGEWFDENGKTWLEHAPRIQISCRN